MPYLKPKSFRTVLSKADFCLNNALPFALYRNPLSHLVHGIFQSDDQLHKALSFKEKGFVFAPFDTKQEAILIKPSEIFTTTFIAEKQLPTPKIVMASSGKEEHLGLIKKALQEIKTGRLQKVVLSRDIAIGVSTKPTAIFKHLLECYSTAFCYLFFHPSVGLWCGASPETLVHIKARKLRTMALAATLPFTGPTPPQWSSKEWDEHAMTANYIRERLTPVLEELHIEEAQSVRAGSLWHLCSAMDGTLRPDTSVKQIITTLHPTSAVCGIPSQAAKAFIQQYENYRRTFYTGFLGALNITGDHDVSLFVNLRCMQLHGDRASLFVGGGITAASDPEKEWNETQDKSKTLLSVL